MTVLWYSKATKAEHVHHIPYCMLRKLACQGLLRPSEVLAVLCPVWSCRRYLDLEASGLTDDSFETQLQLQVQFMVARYPRYGFQKLP